MKMLKHLVIISISLFLLMACGSSNSPSGDKTDVSTNKIVITPGNVILSAAGETLQLSAQSFNSANTAVNNGVSWRSDKPDIVSVNDNGVITSSVSVGKASITAFIDNVESAPIDVTVATIASGVTLVRDKSIISPATLSKPLAMPSASNTYRLELSKDLTYQIGDKLIGSGSDYFGGEIIDITELANSWLITLKQLPLTELFDDLLYKENNKIDDLKPFVNPVILEYFDVVTLANGDLQFTLKEEKRLILEGANIDTTISPKINGSDVRFYNLDPEPALSLLSFVFPCTYNTSTNAEFIAFSAIPNQFVIKHDLDLIFDYDADKNGLEKIAIDGVIEAGVNYNFNVLPQFGGIAQCEMELFTVEPSLPGVFSTLMPLAIPIHVGFKLDGSLQAVSGSLGVSGFTTADILSGIECNEVNCSSLFEGSAETDISYSYSLTSLEALEESTQLNFNFMAYSTVGLRMWGFNFSNYLVGLSERHLFASPIAQIIDDNIEAEYSLHSETGFSPSGDHAGLWTALQFIGLLKPDALVSIQSSSLNSEQLSRSPLAAKVQTELMGTKSLFPIDGYRPHEGYRTRFTLSLLPTTENYFQLNAEENITEETYNIKEVIIYGTGDVNDVTATTNELKRFTAAPGQTEFDIELERNDYVDEDMVYSAFVTTHSGKTSDESINEEDLEYILLGKSKLETYDVEMTGSAYSTYSAFVIGPITVTVTKLVNGQPEPAENVTVNYRDGTTYDYIEKSVETDINGQATLSYERSGFTDASKYNSFIDAYIYIDRKRYSHTFTNPNFTGGGPVICPPPCFP